MIRKLAILTLARVALAGALLVFRQQRLELANHNANLYGRIQDLRQDIWAAQVQSAILTRPQSLEQRVGRAKLKLEPADPTWTKDPRRGWVQASGQITEVAQ